MSRNLYSIQSLIVDVSSSLPPVFLEVIRDGFHSVNLHCIPPSSLLLLSLSFVAVLNYRLLVELPPRPTPRPHAIPVACLTRRKTGMFLKATLV